MLGHEWKELFKKNPKKTQKQQQVAVWHKAFGLQGRGVTGDPLHSRAACTQPCNVNTHSRAHCSPGARLCEQWGHGCVNNGARLCASARLCRGSPVGVGIAHFSQVHHVTLNMLPISIYIEIGPWSPVSVADKRSCIPHTRHENLTRLSSPNDYDTHKTWFAINSQYLNWSKNIYCTIHIACVVVILCQWWVWWM